MAENSFIKLHHEVNEQNLTVFFTSRDNKLLKAFLNPHRFHFRSHKNSWFIKQARFVTSDFVHHRQAYFKGVDANNWIINSTREWKMLKLLLQILAHLLRVHESRVHSENICRTKNLMEVNLDEFTNCWEEFNYSKDEMRFFNCVLCWHTLPHEIFMSVSWANSAELCRGKKYI